jgi:hypothetical protein
MNAFIQFAAIAFAVLGSISVALLLEWLSLWGLMQFMPVQQAQPVAASQNAGERNPLRFRQPGR